MMKKDEQRWAELDALENKAHGILAGGMLLDIDPEALSKEPLAMPDISLPEVEAFLDSIGVRRNVPAKAETVAEMKKAISRIFETNAKVAMLAARNFESLPDEAVKSVYLELLELQERARRRG